MDYGISKKNRICKYFKKIILVFLGTVLLTISAKIKVPFYPVPMTMQTFVVVLIGITFGMEVGTYYNIFIFI